MVYTANWGIICYLPPFTGTRNNHCLQVQLTRCKSLIALVARGRKFNWVAEDPKTEGWTNRQTDNLATCWMMLGIRYVRCCLKMSRVRTPWTLIISAVMALWFLLASGQRASWHVHNRPRSDVADSWRRSQEATWLWFMCDSWRRRCL